MKRVVYFLFFFWGGYEIYTNDIWVFWKKVSTIMRYLSTSPPIYIYINKLGLIAHFLLLRVSGFMLFSIQLCSYYDFIWLQ